MWSQLLVTTENGRRFLTQQDLVTPCVGAQDKYGNTTYTSKGRPLDFTAPGVNLTHVHTSYIYSLQCTLVPCYLFFMINLLVSF